MLSVFQPHNKLVALSLTDGMEMRLDQTKEGVLTGHPCPRKTNIKPVF